jgi:hypothetical protein
LRELNELLDQHQPSGGRANDDDYPEDIDAFRIDLARRIEAFVASQPDDECIKAQPEAATEMDCQVEPGNDEA